MACAMVFTEYVLLWGAQFDEKFSLGSYTTRFAYRRQPRRTGTGIWALRSLLGFSVSAVSELFAVAAVLTVFAAVRSVLRSASHALPAISPAIPALPNIPTLLLLVGCYHPRMVNAVRSGSHSAIRRNRRPTVTAGRSTTSNYQTVNASMEMERLSSFNQGARYDQQDLRQSRRKRP
jgi:hypothetical protein